MEPVTNILPPDFDGTFRFTNASEEDFTDSWNGRGYTFPAMRTTPMIIMDASPVEIQNIRKKFAKKWAVREYFKSDKYKRQVAQERNADGSAKFNSFKQAGQYSDIDLEPYIQQCLTPLPTAQLIVTEAVPEDIESKLSRDEDGELNTQIVSPRGSLKLKNKEKN